MQVFWQLDILFKLVERHPHSGSGHCVRPRHAALGDQLLGLSWVSFVFNSSIRPSDDPIQDNRLLGVAVSWTDTRLDGEFIMLLHLVLQPIQVFLCSYRRKVVTVDRHDQLSGRMLNDTRRGDSLRELQGLHEER